MKFVDGRDAAFARNIGSGYTGVVSGYVGGPNAYNVWETTDWMPFKLNSKVPLWVAGYNGTDEGKSLLSILGNLGIPNGCPMAVDMETRVDESYLKAFAAEVQPFYRILVYGSAGSVFGNPQLNGYWVADYSNEAFKWLQTVGVRAVQYRPDVPPGFDESLWKEWLTLGMWR